MATILNASDLNLPVQKSKGRIYVAGDDRDIENMDWDAINDELNREDDVYVNPRVKDASKSIIITDKRGIPKRKPIFDTKTKNESFLELHEDLKKLGNETNNKFFLRLFDPDLQGIDPFMPNLPAELQIKVFFEVWINPWYFLREICRIPEDGSPICIGGGSQFKIDRNSVATWFLFLNGIDHYGSKPRQCGKTQDALAKQTYAFNWGCTSTQFLFFNKDFPQAKVNLYRLKCQREMLPAYLHMDYAIGDDGSIDKGINNVTSMRNPLNGNQIKCMTKATSVDNARSQGRGDTAAMHYMDEFDFWPYGNEIMNASAFSYSRASENAIKNNSLHCRICTSTPGFTSSKEGAAATKFVGRALPWKDEYLTKPINQLKAMVNSASYNGFVYVEHTWMQLKKSHTWYEKQCALVDYDENTIAREIDLKRISGNEKNPLKKEQQSFITNNIAEPIEEIDYSNNLCPFLVYEKLHRDYPYLLIVDPAEGLGADHDNNAVTILNPYTLRTVIEYKSPYVSQPELFNMLDKLMSEWMPRACVIIEANKGREIINYFANSVWTYNLWYDADKLSSKIVEVSDEYGEAQQKAHNRRALGFDTTPKSRPKLFSMLQVLVEEDIETLCTKYVAKDVLGLVKLPNGRIEAGSGEHDDNIMTKLIGHYVYVNASNLEEFGIIKGARPPEDTSKPRTEEENLQKLKELMPGLPPEVQALFKQSVEMKNPVTEANKYHRQIEVQRSINQAQQTPFNQTNNHNPGYIDQAQSDVLWGEFNRSLGNFNSDSKHTQFGEYDSYGGGSHNAFDMEDYI